jgi:hypothetical protein
MVGLDQHNTEPLRETAGVSFKETTTMDDEKQVTTVTTEQMIGFAREYHDVLVEQREHTLNINLKYLERSGGDDFDAICASLRIMLSHDDPVENVLRIAAEQVTNPDLASQVVPLREVLLSILLLAQFGTLALVLHRRGLIDLREVWPK